jgi:hypothetical protein
MNIKLHDKLVESYLNMIQNDEVRAENDNTWTAEELAGYYLYNCSKNELLHDEFVNVKNEIPLRMKTWKLVKKVFYPRTYMLRIA